ncbi:putative DNA-binding protein [Treponema primitia ZAS-2]|uniref:Putative DNA-binding protein n=1 Tax=Treponema primitia (strain ATCC BAA-887 / DSM 12427 / ZAS-2) TaxID=545694 RepID=F5YI22_TREPZ|nr:RhuM family protein [Treponema primitia]AEF85070.1 putative DNA-binding protein [Treponema primitia ZAS-2]
MKEDDNTPINQIIIYQKDNTVKFEVRLEHETVWLTQVQIADLFGTQRPAVTKHLRNIYNSGELDEDGTCSILEHMGNDASQRYQTKYYNLDAILSVGYRVNSINATHFRQWANRVLKDYLLKGYAINKRFERIERQVSNTKRRLVKTEEKIEFFVKTALPPVEGIFYDGQIFDAYTFVADLIKSAKKSIVLIDNYIDESVLTVLSKRAKSVQVILYTPEISAQLQLDIKRHNAQYPSVTVKTFKKSHDRFLIIDDTVYHIGASLKDLGKKWFAFSKMMLDAADLLKRLNKP